MMDKERDEEYYGSLSEEEAKAKGFDIKKYVQMFVNYLKESKAKDMKKSTAVV